MENLKGEKNLKRIGVEENISRGQLHRWIVRYKAS